MAAFERTLAACAFVVIGLIGAGPASAVSPQRIYADLADNGRLDGRYAPADIARALDVGQVVRTDVRKPTPSAHQSRPAKESSDGLPFTGLDLALLTVGGGPLLLIGFGLRRRLAATEAARVEVAGG
jgi:hypothetical protein